MNIAKTLKRAGLAGTVLVLIAVSYYSWALYSAREYTTETILPREKSACYPIDLSSLSLDRR